MSFLIRDILALAREKWVFFFSAATRGPKSANEYGKVLNISDTTISYFILHALSVARNIELVLHISNIYYIYILLWIPDKTPGVGWLGIVVVVFLYI